MDGSPWQLGKKEREKMSLIDLPSHIGRVPRLDEVDWSCFSTISPVGIHGIQVSLGLRVM